MAHVARRNCKKTPAGYGRQPPAGEILIMQGYVTSSGILEHRTVEMSIQKISPGACPLAGTGRGATYNNSWQIRNRASIPHSTSRGLVASVFAYVCFILIAGFCRTGGRIVTQTNALINDETKVSRHRLITIYNTHCKKNARRLWAATPGGRNFINMIRTYYFLGDIRTPNDGNVNGEFDLRFPPLPNHPRT